MNSPITVSGISVELLYNIVIVAPEKTKAAIMIKLIQSNPLIVRLLTEADALTNSLAHTLKS